MFINRTKDYSKEMFSTESNNQMIFEIQESKT